MTQQPEKKRFIDIFAGEYGMLAVLLVLVVLMSLLTITDDKVPEGREGGTALASQLSESVRPGGRIFIAAKDSQLDREFVTALEEGLASTSIEVAGKVNGKHPAIRAGLEAVEGHLDAIACVPSISRDPIFDDFVDTFEGEGKLAARLISPTPYVGSTFLNPSNLRNITGRASVISILAIGMTMIIITSGIDLSVGSLVAFSAVVATFMIRAFGGADAGVMDMICACAIAVCACGMAGALTGWTITAYCVPPFIATLAMMQILRGASFKIAENETITAVPESFKWLGNGMTMGIPNSVILVVVLYAIAHVIMSKTKLGRYIYATGGNAEAARLSGVPVKRIKLLVYIAGGALAGLGGVVEASRLGAGAGKFGDGYELEVIAAVVVGGTSLFGGRGKVLGTLIGVMIIMVIRNGMNLKGLHSETQLIVLGLVILAAVILERVRSGEWRSSVGG